MTAQGPKTEGKAGGVRQGGSSEEEELERDQDLRAVGNSDTPQWSPASGSRDRGPSVLRPQGTELCQKPG